LLCEKCSTKHEDHYLEEILYRSVFLDTNTLQNYAFPV
jgi:hypothetical protein